MTAGGGSGITVSVRIEAPLERVWALTQDPANHPRWDLRFSRITPVAPTADGASRFTYERSLPLHTIRGTGTSIGELSRPDGTRTSALRFTTRDRVSPLRGGRGYWRYTPDADGVVFRTGYDYEPGWGRLLDRLVMRRVIAWMTAVSFDRLRIWAETGREPSRFPVASLLAPWARDHPRASRTEWRARHAAPLRDAPATLDTLEHP